MRPAPAPESSPHHHRMSADERRRQLIEASMDLFSQKGFAGTTTKEIAAAAGVTEAIIFRHFATKRDLYSAIVERMCSSAATEEWLREARALMDRNDDAGLIHYLLKGILDFARTDPRYERLLLFAALEGHELALIHQTSLSNLSECFVEYIQRRQREGAIVDTSPGLVMGTIIGGMKFYAGQKYLFGCSGEIEDNRAVEDLVRLVLHGIASKPGKGRK